MKLLFTPEWLRKKIESDPDVDYEAGRPIGTRSPDVKMDADTAELVERMVRAKTLVDTHADVLTNRIGVSWREEDKGKILDALRLGIQTNLAEIAKLLDKLPSVQS